MKVINANYITSVVQNKLMNREDIIMVGPSTISELDYVKDEDVIGKVQASLENIFIEVKKYSIELMKKRNGTIIFLLNPLVFNGGEGTYSPVYNLSIIGFMKSLSKEMNPFQINVVCVILPLINTNKPTKKYNLVTLKYRGMNPEEQASSILKLLRITNIINGQVISLGSELNF